MNKFYTISYNSLNKSFSTRTYASADLFKRAALKAKKLGDDRADKFMKAYLDKLAQEFNSEDVEDTTKILNQWYKQDKLAFAKLKSTYGRNASRPRYGVSAKDIKVPAGMDLVSQLFFVGTFVDEDANGENDRVEINISTKWLALDDDKYAFIRNNGKRIVVMNIGAEWSSGNPMYLYGTYNIDDDEFIVDKSDRQNAESFDDLFDGVEDEGMKYVNQFFRCINPRHKDFK